MSIMGNVVQVGKDATNCQFYIQYAPTHLGYGSEQCTFFIENMHEPSKNKNSAEIPYIGFSGLKKPSLPNEFSAKGNHLYIHDAEGEWKEIFS